MYAFLLLLAVWPFTPAAGPGHTHSRGYHARHLRHTQEARAKRLAKRGVACPSFR